jgi:hypothetical protein
MKPRGLFEKFPKITDFWIYSGIKKFMDWVHRSWTDGAPRSMVDQSGVSIEAAVAHGRRKARQAWGRAGGAGEGEQGRVRLGDSSPRQNTRWRGDAMRSETAMAAASWWWPCKRMGGEESKAEGVGNEGERRGPFIVTGEGHAGVRKGETAGGNGLNTIEGRAA